MRVKGWRLPAAVVVAALLVALAACSGSDDGDTGGAGGGSGTGGSGGVSSALRVPQRYKTIQAAVDAAKPGQLVLVAPGVYREAVDVTTEDVTIRGTDRNEVILDGGFELENGIRVLETDGVVVENMTARNYVSNGFFWTGSDRYRGSYLTAYRNGDYGIYAFDAYHGQFDHSYGSGSPDAGFYIGACYRCDAVLDDVTSEYNGLGYSGTNSGGDLYIVNSTFRRNRAGIVPNSGSYEPCYPGRRNTIVGNLVYDNNYLDGPGIDVSLMAQGNGILLAGSVENVVERNRVEDHERTGIAMVPFPEDEASAEPPPESEFDERCRKPKQGGAEQKVGFVLWNASGNRIVDNVVTGSGLADLASATIPDEQAGITVEGLDNCFSGNRPGRTAPVDLEQLAPCDGKGSGGSFDDGALDLGKLIAEQPPKPEPDSYRTTPVPPDQPQMPNARNAPVRRFTRPKVPDVKAIDVPDRPKG